MVCSYWPIAHCIVSSWQSPNTTKGKCSLSMAWYGLTAMIIFSYIKSIFTASKSLAVLTKRWWCPSLPWCLCPLLAMRAQPVLTCCLVRHLRNQWPQTLLHIFQLAKNDGFLLKMLLRWRPWLRRNARGRASRWGRQKNRNMRTKSLKTQWTSQSKHMLFLCLTKFCTTIICTIIMLTTLPYSKSCISYR